MESNHKILAALLAGAVFGSAIGLLFAPKKGRTTRRKIRRKFNNNITKLTDSIDDLKEKMAEAK